MKHENLLFTKKHSFTNPVTGPKKAFQLSKLFFYHRWTFKHATNAATRDHVISSAEFGKKSNINHTTKHTAWKCTQYGRNFYICVINFVGFQLYINEVLDEIAEHGNVDTAANRETMHIQPRNLEKVNLLA